MGVTREKVTVYRCERCEHRWIPRDPWTMPAPEDLPRVCPKCKSPYWNRGYASAESEAAAKARKKAAKKKATKKRARKKSTK